MASLGTWIFIQVRKQCQNQKNQEYQTKCHSETRKKQRPEECTQVYDNTLIETKTPYDYCLEDNRQSEINVIVAMMSRKLTKLERLIFLDYYLKNKTVTQIKQKYHLNDIDNLLEKFKTLLRVIKEQVV